MKSFKYYNSRLVRRNPWKFAIVLPISITLSLMFVILNKKWQNHSARILLKCWNANLMSTSMNTQFIPNLLRFLDVWNHGNPNWYFSCWKILYYIFAWFWSGTKLNLLYIHLVNFLLWQKAFYVGDKSILQLWKTEFNFNRSSISIQMCRRAKNSILEFAIKIF